MYCGRGLPVLLNGSDLQDIEKPAARLNKLSKSSRKKLRRKANKVAKAGRSLRKGNRP